MGFRLGPDGKPQEVETSFAKTPLKDAVEGGTQPPNRDGKTQPPKVDLFNHMMNSQSDTVDEKYGQDSISQEPPTEPIKQGFGQHKMAEEPKTSIAMGRAGSEAAEFVCGWFVIVDGPGKGKSINIGPGQSFVSRSSLERITMNFGDNSITSKHQLLIIFDDEMSEFIIGPGNGSSLNRLNGQVIASQAVLNTGDLIKIGATTVRFIAFCDQSFSWNQ